MLVCNDREKLVWLVQIANIYNSFHIDFVRFREHTLSSFIIQLHPATTSNFSFTIFLFFFYFSLQRCIICAKLFYRLKKNPTACIEYGIICFYWIQGIAFMFISVGNIFFWIKKRRSSIHPEKANYKIVLWKDIRKVFHHTQSRRYVII